MTKPTTARRQGLRTAIRNARKPGTDLHRALNGLDGCPVGGWAETAQAQARIADAIPHRSERSYRIADLIEAVMVEDHAGRWRWRD